MFKYNRKKGKCQARVLRRNNKGKIGKLVSTHKLYYNIIIFFILITTSRLYHNPQYNQRGHLGSLYRESLLRNHQQPDQY